MALFEKPLDLKENSFTLEEAAAVFKDVAKQIEDGKIPANVVDTVLDVARLILSVAKAFTA